MSERFKYSLSGVYRCENFAQHLAQNNFPTFPIVPIGTVGRIAGWYMILQKSVIDNQTFVYPFMHCYDKPQVKIHSFFNILGKDGKSIFRIFGDIVLEKEFGPYGKDMNILDVLNEKNGYLDNGTLSIEYGIHVDGIEGVDGIWKFNFNDKLFNPKDTLTIEYKDAKDGSLKVFYCHRQLLRFHSSLFSNQVNNFISTRTEDRLIDECLQIAHGVRIPLDRTERSFGINLKGTYSNTVFPSVKRNI
ncbi:hypothetical protein CAEBREN_09157 [Caenorhabditis brenneri]|uniref:Uncharacterized protein n=1 Tax=Caenorhabditis brenneri TaxID=135651 RepID=G0MCN2_CAEBE|nr:hypothetical protein CAEBREN_09157 [Caenorhabditis brenneri]